MPIADVSSQALVELVRLTGRSAVVTGGARGIGEAIVRRLAEAGADVIIGDIDPTAGEEAAAAARGFGRRVQAVHLDVTQEQSLIDLADTAVSTLGRIDIWVNNAGVFPGGATVDFLASQWDEIQDINLRGTFLGAREAARRMIAQRPEPGGVIINIASTTSFRGRPQQAAYVASKHGVVGLTKSLAVELGPQNIRVLAVAPTGTLTPGVDALKTRDGGDQRERLEALERSVRSALPLGRLAVPDDVARVVLFCASDLSMLMTGSTMLVDAGGLAN